MTRRLILIIALAFLLRAAFVGSFPALYADEAAFGYNAYLLLHSGRDEFGRAWPMGLESFGDWKPPMSAWLSIPFIKLFGLNEFAVRLPSVILGTATVGIVYFLTREILKRSDLAAIATLLLAISPWHIVMSRMAMLVGIEVFFVSLGVLGLLRGLNSGSGGRAIRSFSGGWWIVSAIAFSGAVYSYYGSRVTVPLVLLSFFLVFRKDIASHLRSAFLSGCVGIVLLLPLFATAIRNPLVLTGRARTTSIFFNDNVRLQLWDSRTKAGLQHIPPFVTRFFDNKFYYYSTDIIRRYVQHFSPPFLFFQGDHQAPFRTTGIGVIHILDLPFFLIGLLAIRKIMKTGLHVVEDSDSGRDGKKALFLCLYFFLAPFVASLTFLTPAANRSFNLVIPWAIVTAFGIVSVLRHFSSITFLSVALGVAFYAISLSIFLFRYAIETPQDYPRNWQVGKKELVQKVKPLLSSVDTIISTDHGGPAYIFFAFYLPITPEEFHRTIVRNQEFDELGWEHVDRILNITIPRSFTWKKAPINQDAVYIGFENELPHDKIDLVGRVYYPNGGVAYEIGTLKYWVTE